MIYDSKTQKFYEITRSWRGRPQLTEIVFESIRCVPGEGDLVINKYNELKPFEIPPEPPTPQP